MKLYDIAHARAGDKGNTSDITVFAYEPISYPLLEQQLTAECVKAHFGGMVQGDIARYCLPGFYSIKFVMNRALGGGVTRSLALDAHGKCLSSVLLDLEIAFMTGQPTDSGISNVSAHVPHD